MSKLRIKKGDLVTVVAGDHKGDQGVVTKIIKSTTSGKSTKVIVEGINKVTKHVKPSAENPQGGIISLEAPMDISNIAFLHNGKATRIEYLENKETGKFQRYSKLSNEFL